MSSIPTKQIDGDVSVGRDVNIGGKATIRGSAKVGHNLTVDGWLEAKNIKGPNKGLFKTAAQLREAYPNPHKGWWALVTIEGSVASDHLGQLYVVDGGTWVAQVDSNGNPLLRGNPTVDSTKYFDAYIETLKPWLGGTLGSFDSSEAFNNYLDGLTYNSLKSGRYVAYLGGVPFFVTFTLLYAKEQISAIWVEGSLMVSDNAINSNTGKGVTIAYRYHKNGAWEAWKTIYDELNGAVVSQGSRISTLEGKMPSVQTSANGTTKNYIYSASGDDMHTALSSKIWTYTHGDGNLFLRFKHWGASNDTSESNYSQVMVANAWIGGNGVLRRDVYRRLDDFSLREENSTADAVNIVTPIFTTGGTRSFPISKATTAKAGVMTAAQVTALNKASEDVKALNDSLQGFQEDLTEFKNTKGHSNGLAPLDETGKVPSKYLPENVLEFSGMVSGITPQTVSLNKYSSDENCSVVYSKDREVFMLKYEQPSTSPFLPATITYYNNWIDGDLFGELSADADGRVPHSCKIYIDVTTNKTYYWRGITLKTIGATAQDGVHGTSENYIYSASGDDVHTALSSKLWIYQHGDYNQFLRFKKWGASNDQNETDYCQVQLPNAWTGGTGLLKWDVYRRLDEFKLREENSTADAVNIVTPIFTTGGTRSFSISKATTAKAGVMNVEDKIYIETLKPWLRGSLGNFDSSEAFNKYLNGLSYDTLKSGRYVAYLGGVPFFVTFSVLYAKEQISAIWVEGSLMVTENVISSNTGKGVTICYRYYKNGAWETWKTIYDDLNGVVTDLKAKIVALEKKVAALEAKIK